MYRNELTARERLALGGREFQAAGRLVESNFPA